LLDIDKISSIHKLSKQLIAKNQADVLKIKELEKRCKALELNLKDKNLEIKEIKEKNKDLKLQGVQSNLNSEDKRVLKSRLSELIKDVDRCIETLSK
jgi:GTPase involved in cell partitioning and DNA repair